MGIVFVFKIKIFTLKWQKAWILNMRLWNKQISLWWIIFWKVSLREKSNFKVLLWANNPRITFGHASYDFMLNFLSAEKMRVVSCDVNMLAISRGES